MEGRDKDDDRAEGIEQPPDIPSLDGLTAKECYLKGLVVGFEHGSILFYELADVEHQILDGKPFTRQVRVDNREAIERCCQDAKVTPSWRWLSGDKTEGWLELKVVGK